MAGNPDGDNRDDMEGMASQEQTYVAAQPVGAATANSSRLPKREKPISKALTIRLLSTPPSPLMYVTDSVATIYLICVFFMFCYIENMPQQQSKSKIKAHKVVLGRGFRFIFIFSMRNGKKCGMGEGRTLPDDDADDFVQDMLCLASLVHGR